VSGERDADTIDAAVAALRRDQVRVVRITPQKAARAPSGRSAGRTGHAVAARTLAVFTRQLSAMIDAGLPLLQCLEILGTQEDDRNFAATIRATRADVEAGASLADAMRRHPRAFDPLFTSMIAAGEAGGILDTILKRLATHGEKTARLKAQVRSAMVYPVAVISIAGLVVGVILWKVVPAFEQLFGGLGADLPLPTRVVIAMSDGFVSYFIPLAAMGSGAGWLASRYYRTDAGRRAIDRSMLGLPLLGDILRKIAVARFCRTLATLTSSGVPILDGLAVTARTSGNAVIEDAVMFARRSIERGETIAAPLRRTAVFPAMVTKMVAVGEEAGALDTMLAKIADFYEEEADTAVAGLLTLLEPAMILVLGVVVGGIVIAMYLPIFDLVGRLA
jgi:type IV pilus assembly protein PilC